MKREFITAKNIIKEQGIFVLFKTITKNILQLLLVPYYTIKLKIINFKSNEDILNFSYNSKLGILTPCQIRSEATALLSKVAELKPKRVMELGTGKGGNLFLLSRASPEDAKIISLDMRGGPYGAGYPSWKILLLQSFKHGDQEMILVDADSHNIETRDKIRSILNNEKLDVLFIDGDHTYEGVKKDFELYSPFVRSGGLIAFHDIVDARKLDPTCNVNLFWNEIKDNYKYEESINNRAQIWGGIGFIEQA
jgi:predicted O-methyltransferase YrrM